MREMSSPLSPGRRAFLRKAAALAASPAARPVGGLAAALATMGEASAAPDIPYKALVCVFMLGGNDDANTVVPYDAASWSAYSRIRAGVAHTQASLDATALRPAVALAGGRQYALHPSMGALAGLFHRGKMAVQLNVGPLVIPITRAQYESADRRSFPLPPKLFSHNDQQSVWQSSSPEGSTVGWGGNLGDLALPYNGGSLFTCMSVSGNMVFLSGDQALQYQVSPSGVVAVDGLASLWYGGDAVRQAFSQVIQAPRAHVLENEYNRVTQRSIASEARLRGALDAVRLTTPFPASNPLASQMRMVARLIGARQSLGLVRQVFMVTLPGFDLHDNLLKAHGPLLQQVSEAMAAFHDATVELGVDQQVTAFTASDFGRTLSPNGAGSDHGWGSHHWIVGGAVRGQAFYGTPPPVSAGETGSEADQSHVGQGRLIPTTSVDQYAATLSSWLGVPDPFMNQVVPNINRFGAAAGRPDYPWNLGFMN